MRLFRERVVTKTEYITRWLPRPNNSDLVRVLQSTEFDRFMEMCKEEMANSIQLQDTPEARNEAALEYRGIVRVERRAKELIARHNMKKEEEKAFSLELTDEDALAREFEEHKNGSNKD